jgi:uncharacterized protein DUF642
MKLASFTVLFLAMAFRLPAGTSGPLPFSNGSFETGDFTDWNNNGHIIVSSADGAEQGNYSAIFNTSDSTPNGLLSQTFATVSGTQYLLTFYYGDNGSSGQSQNLDVLVSGIGTLLSQTANSGNANSGTTIFTQINYNFTANSASTTLQFTDDSANVTGSHDGVLDNVQVTAVPEANAAWTGFGALLLAVLSKRRFWRRSQPASIAPSVSP